MAAASCSILKASSNMSNNASLSSVAGRDILKLVWVTQGRTEHPAWLLEEVGEKTHVQIQWESTRGKETVPIENVIFEFPTRRKRQTRKDTNVSSFGDGLITKKTDEKTKTDAETSKTEKKTKKRRKSAAASVPATSNDPPQKKSKTTESEKSSNSKKRVKRASTGTIPTQKSGEGEESGNKELEQGSKKVSIPTAKSAVPPPAAKHSTVKKKNSIKSLTSKSIFTAVDSAPSTAVPPPPPPKTTESTSTSKPVVLQTNVAKNDSTAPPAAKPSTVIKKKKSISSLKSKSITKANSGPTTAAPRPPPTKTTKSDNTSKPVVLPTNVAKDDSTAPPAAKPSTVVKKKKSIITANSAPTTAVPPPKTTTTQSNSTSKPVVSHTNAEIKKTESLASSKINGSSGSTGMLSVGVVKEKDDGVPMNQIDKKILSTTTEIKIPEKKGETPLLSSRVNSKIQQTKNDTENSAAEEKKTSSAATESVEVNDMVYDSSDDEAEKERTKRKLDAATENEKKARKLSIGNSILSLSSSAPSSKGDDGNQRLPEHHGTKTPSSSLSVVRPGGQPRNDDVEDYYRISLRPVLVALMARAPGKYKVCFSSKGLKKIRSEIGQDIGALLEETVKKISSA